MDIEKLFDGIKLEKHKSSDGMKYLDPSRNIFLNITPEETVRQKMIIYLHETIGVPYHNIFTEDHLSHYIGTKTNGRIDIALVDDNDKAIAIIECKANTIPIEAEQVLEQANKYASEVHAQYIILVNGISMYFYRLENDRYISIDTNITWNDMLQGEYEDLFLSYVYERIPYESYNKIANVKTMLKERCRYIIGEDTPDEFVPFIANFDDALMDDRKTLLCSTNGRFELLNDCGIQYRTYGDASGSDFGTGWYRTFLIKDLLKHNEFLIGLGLLAVGKTVNHPKFGNLDGKSVLVVFRNDGKKDEMSVQINLNKFLTIKYNKAIISHNAAVTRKGANKEDAIKYISEKNNDLIVNGNVYLGEFDISKNIVLDDPEVSNNIWRILEYSIYRDEYKQSLTKKSRRQL